MLILHGGVFLSEIKLGLERVFKLLQSVDNPHEKLKFVHIAGTNGKGSTAAMIANTCICAGLKTGLFISPHIRHVSEMVNVNNKSIPKSRLDGIINKISIDKSDPATEFEVMVAVAMKYFYDEMCDIVVLEVGMGGRLDATNVIGTPEVAVITSIGLDHMDFLGPTIEHIAAEKAGIIKANGICISYPQSPSVLQVIADKCKNVSTELSVVTNPEEVLELSLLGKHQKYNAAVALKALNVLQEKGYAITNDDIAKGLATTKWEGRFEVLYKNPIFVLDGAHNPQAVQIVVNTLNELYPNKNVIFIFGTLADKEYTKMADIILPIAKKIYTITPDSPRALSADDLANYINSHKAIAAPSASIQYAVKIALDSTKNDEVICAIGSLYNFEQIKATLADNF